jgi:hypothetical protein
MSTTNLFLFWTPLFALLPLPTTGFPMHFPLSTFTHSISIPAAHVPIFNNPGTDSLLWTRIENGAPPILLCSSPDLTGSCTLFENNPTHICLTLPSPLALGSVKVVGRATCTLFSYVSHHIPAPIKGSIGTNKRRWQEQWEHAQADGSWNVSANTS